MKEMKRMKKKIKKMDDEENHYEKWMMNTERLESVISDLQDEIYFYKHGLYKIYDITNTYHIGNDYFVEMKTHTSRNQNEALHRYIESKIQQYPSLLHYLEENAKKKNPDQIQIRVTKKGLETIVYVNKKSYSLIDFAVSLQNNGY
jgi:hypothetical protein